MDVFVYDFDGLFVLWEGGEEPEGRFNSIVIFHTF